MAKQAAACLDLAAAATLASPSLAGLGGVWSERWEGLATGPHLPDGSHVVLAGTEDDYSVTQDAGSVQRGVYFKPLPAGGVSSIRCDIDIFTNCLISQQLTRLDTPTTFNYVILFQ